MEKIQLISDKIDQVLESIRPIYSIENYFMKDPTILLEELKNSLTSINSINLFEIENEIWECKNDFRNESETISFISTFFTNLFLWKEDINTNDQLFETIHLEINSINSRTLLTSVSQIQLSAIRKVYVQIGVKLLKLKQDYLEITKNFTRRVESEKAIAKKEFQRTPYFSFKLNVDKAEEVALYINTIIDKHYFESVNPDKPFLKADILNAVGFIFSCKLHEFNTEQNLILSSIINPVNNNIISAENKEESYAITPFLLHSDKEKLAKRMKEVFNIEKGKSIKLLIKALEENKPPLIAIDSRGFKKIYTALSETFGRDIGSYQGISGYKYNEIADKQDYEAIKNKLNHILMEF